MNKPADVVLGFDANLPKMDMCHDNCHSNPLCLCRHRFNFTVFIRRYNTKASQRLEDSKIILDFFEFVEKMIGEKLVSSDSLFVIVTKDGNFLSDAEKEFEADKESFGFIFANGYVRREEIRVYVMNINSKKRQKTKKRNRKQKIYNKKSQIRTRKYVIYDLKHIISKMNKFFRQKLRNKAD